MFRQGGAAYSTPLDSELLDSGGSGLGIVKLGVWERASNLISRPTGSHDLVIEAFKAIFSCSETCNICKAARKLLV